MLVGPLLKSRPHGRFLRIRCCAWPCSCADHGQRGAGYSTGGKAYLMEIGERGNNYVRRLRIHAARA